MSPEDPEMQIAATSLLGLWQIQFRALSKYMDSARPPAQVRKAITADVSRAAQLINAGLSTLDPKRPSRRRTTSEKQLTG
jgi:hypothetical protein